MASKNIFEREPESWLQRLLARPSQTCAHLLYSRRQHILKQSPRWRQSAYTVTVVCISDTHNRQPALPDADILVHAGDLTETGTKEEMQKQLDWIDSRPHEHKFVIAGNHDIVLDLARSAKSGMTPEDLRSLRWGSIHYVNYTTAQFRVRGRPLSVFGHPSTRRQGNWAFQHDRDMDVFGGRIPEGLDILITHSPPQHHLDLTGQGDPYLLKELWRTRPRLHVFGHLHAGHGQEVLVYDHFTALYERVCAGDAGMFALILMGLLLAWMYVVGIDDDVKVTVLINAAVVGGNRNVIKNKARVVHM